MGPTFFDRTIMKPFLILVPKGLSPNVITVFRLVCVPVIVYLLLTASYISGAILFFIAAFSDALDGAVARTRGETSELGALIDPIADKLLIVSVALILIEKFLPIWMFFSLVSLEVIIVLFALFNKYKKHLGIKANIFGKIKMFLQCIGVLSLLIYVAVWPESRFITYAFWILFVAIFLAATSLIYDIVLKKQASL